MRRLAIAATVAMLGIAACSSDSSSSPSTVGDTVVTTDPATVTETVVEAADTTVPSGDGAGTEFCAINQELNDSDIPLEGTPADLEAYFTGFFPDALSRLEGAVPAELADDVDTLISGVSQIGGLLEANDWSAEAAFSDPAFAALATDPEFEAAGNRVDEYCGL